MRLSDAEIEQERLEIEQNTRAEIADTLDKILEVLKEIKAEIKLK